MIYKEGIKLFSANINLKVGFNEITLSKGSNNYYSLYLVRIKKGQKLSGTCFIKNSKNLAG